MVMTLTVTMLPPIVIGLLITRTFLPLNRPAAASWLLNLSLGAGLGIGVLSLLFFLARLLVGPSNLVYGIAEILTLAAAAAGCWLFRDKLWSGEEPRPFGGWQWLLLAATVVCLILAEAQFLDSSAASPYGNWDAWSIWNLRAKLLAQPNVSWKNAFSPLLNQLAGGGATHGDYPLLLSGYIARCWSLAGTIGDVTVPIAVAGLFALATVGLLIGGLAVLRGWTTGLTAGLILLGTGGFLRNGDWQFSDVPLGFFYLAVFILFFMFDARGGTRRLAIGAGLALGCAAWTKDEGMFFALFAILALIAGLVVSRAHGWLKSLALLAAGAAPPLAVSLYFKIFLAPKGIWAPVTIASAVHKIFDASRYVQILTFLWTGMVALGTGVAHPAICLAVLAVCLGIPRERLRRPIALSAGGLFLAITGAYFFSYVVTPLDLAWHLGTSAGRLMVQLLPSAIFLVLAVCRSAEETAIPIDEPKRDAHVRSKQKHMKRAHQAAR